MPRQNRLINPDGGVYHITARGNNKMCLFHSRRDYLKYMSITQETKAYFPFEVFHFCLMPNHIHLCMKPLSGEHLPLIMKRINETYSRYFRKKHNYVGHVWQGRYFSSPVENDRYLWACGAYIESNPVRAGLCSKPHEYEWSSSRHYLTKSNHFLVTDNPQFKLLGKSRVDCALIYKDFF